MGRTRLLLPRKASAGGSEEGAGVLGVWVGAGSCLPCLAGAASCWHKATWLGPLLVGHIYTLSSTWLLRLPGGVRAGRPNAQDS